MSIFDNTFVEPGWECVQAQKNITREGEYKYINLNLMYQLGDRQAEVAAVYALNLGGKVSREVPVKMLIKMYDLSGDKTEDPVVLFKRSLRAWKPEEITEEMVKDLLMANAMFDKADAEVQRIFV